MSSTANFEQLIRFTTDSVGLERTFRLFQATVQIILSYPLAFDAVLYTLNVCTTRSPSPGAAQSVLLGVRQRLDLARRFFRVFRFLDSFYAAHKLYIDISPSSPNNGKREPNWNRAETWIKMMGCTFNGMYLLLDASTSIDAFQIEGLNFWQPATLRAITIEAQRFWLFALVCGVLSGLVKMVNVLLYTPAPETQHAYSKTEEDSAIDNKGTAEKAHEITDVQKLLWCLQNFVTIRGKGSILRLRDARSKLYGPCRSTIASALDIILPGVIVGWVHVSPGTVGLTMFFTTILTGMDVWERCGKEASRTD